ncbi:MAG: hypothetical protein VCC36_09545 [Gammaproteobacteria bacterium]|jgi:hypothetical protein
MIEVLMTAFLIAYNFSRRRVVHPIYVAGIIVLGMESSGVRHAIHQTDFWIGFNNWMVSVLSS